MSLLDTASLIVTPNGYKEGKLYSVIPSYGSGDMSVVRATTATRVNSAGLVELVPYNLLQQSENFTTTWTQINSISVTGNTATAPNGTLTADTLLATISPSVIRQGVSTSPASIYTFSVWLKKASGTPTTRIRIEDNVAPYNSTFVNVTPTNEWVRYEVTRTIGAGITDIVADIFPDFVNGTGSVYAWGAQLNEGSLKDYQKTETRLNIPRLDYSNGSCPSLLVEPQRTNVALWSSSFDNAWYTKTNATITANNAVSPDGSNNADLLTYTTSAGFLLSSVYLGSATTETTVSLFVKAGTSNLFNLGISDGILEGWYYTFNLATQTATLTVAPAFFTSPSFKIENYGNGWYRLVVSAVSTVNGRISLYAQSVAGLTANYNIYGAQVEVGSYATSYIPTTSASVTRNADVISKTGISSLIGQTEGTIFWDIYVDTPSATGHEDIFNIDNGSFGNTIYLAKLSNAAFACEMYVSNVQQATFTKTGITAGRHKIAFAYANNNTAMFFDGVQVGSTDTSCSVPTMSRIQLGQGVLGPSTGFTNAAALWQTRLDNATLATLTTL